MNSVGFTFWAIDPLDGGGSVLVVGGYVLTHVVTIVRFVLAMAAVVLHNGQMFRLRVPFQGHLFKCLKFAGSAGQNIFMAKFFVVCEVFLMVGFVRTQLTSKSIEGFLNEVTCFVLLTIFTRLAANTNSSKTLILVMIANVACDAVLVEGFVVTAFTRISDLLPVNGNHVSSHVLVL